MNKPSAKKNQKQKQKPVNRQFVTAFTREDIQALNEIVNEMPTKWGTQIIAFFNKVMQARLFEQSGGKTPVGPGPVDLKGSEKEGTKG